MTTAPAALPPYLAQRGPAHARRNRVPFPPAASPVRRAPAARKTATTTRNAHRPRGWRGSASHRHIAKTMTRLCSPAARFITRQAIAVDGEFAV
ncbi:SDR family oxidoreductase [Burkholderia cepacia]|uniref:SDR family oxidoreductase n=1 Tax=Burkholderia cepacia TaxID=292 RepID=UPI001CF455C1|nr:SDR family oxidoreductase [Burkholderia cepacia]MCA8282423.1 SDR family oxidoreductase [Burkholderia cepacia]